MKRGTQELGRPCQFLMTRGEEPRLELENGERHQAGVSDTKNGGSPTTFRESYLLIVL
ncbi:hypothetical protein [Desulfonema magnum]|uniref:Uncharacterized protein n=1 Tax=Desulfonema magnum TaxID=45655 RepID=A0A975BGL3_9BACT|nr:hypothetical protein [Desulfonema magnum]QTA85037.1 Uncharacterized protein dnm_010410 [Desulfonema magnum]